MSARVGMRMRLVVNLSRANATWVTVWYETVPTLGWGRTFMSVEAMKQRLEEIRTQKLALEEEANEISYINEHATGDQSGGYAYLS